MAYTLGIDFGTSTTRVAISQDGTLPLAIPIGLGGDDFMPSVVAYRRTADGRAEVLSIGEDALDAPDTDGVTVIREVKRCLAVAEQINPPVTILSRWWNQENRCFQLWDSSVRADEIIYVIIYEALTRAVETLKRLGIAADLTLVSIRGLSCRLGTSVTSGLTVRRELAELVNRLGFDDFRTSQIIEEPVLAALSYVSSLQVKTGDKVLVYDFGGGTFDVAIVDVDELKDGSYPKLTVLAADGEQRLGGSDIDEAFLNHIITRVSVENFGFKDHELQAKLKEHPEEKQALRNQVRRVKEALSDRDEASLLLLSFLGRPLDITVNRDELEMVVRNSGILAKSLECTIRAFRRAVTTSEGKLFAFDPKTGSLAGSIFELGDDALRQFVQKILIVGGTTRMPLIRQTITDLWGAERVIEEDVLPPITATAQGAAWQQEELTGIVDRLPFSIFLEQDREDDIELYKAFTPTAIHRINTDNPRIQCYRYPFDAPKPSNGPRICFYDPEGNLIESRLLQINQLGRIHLEIDLFGRCVIKLNQKELLEIPNPAQHPRQVELWKEFCRARDRKKADVHETLLDNVRVNPGLTNQ